MLEEKLQHHDEVNRDCNSGIPNRGIPVNFANPEIPGLSTRNPGIFWIEKFPINVHYYYVTKWHFMFCCKCATAIVQDCMSLPSLVLVNLLFTARRYAYGKGGFCCRPVSISSSVLSRSCTVSRRLKISSNFFLGPVDIYNSNVLTPYACTQFQGELLQRGRQINRRWEKFAIFDWNRRLFRNQYDIGPLLLWNYNRKL